jgi:hypothetical protein
MHAPRALSLYSFRPNVTETPASARPKAGMPPLTPPLTVHSFTCTSLLIRTRRCGNAPSPPPTLDPTSGPTASGGPRFLPHRRRPRSRGERGIRVLPATPGQHLRDIRLQLRQAIS